MFDKVNLVNSPSIHNGQAQVSNETNQKEKFQSALKDALQKVSQIENEANLQQQRLIEGKSDDLHNVMLAAQKATLTIETTVQIQQKVIDAYNEVMRMQI